MSRSILMDSLLTRLRSAVRRRCTLTWSLSATSIPASLPPQVSPPQPRPLRIQLTIYHRSFDLQVRWNRQAYHREVREGKKSFRCRLAPLAQIFLIAFAPRWGKILRHQQQIFAPGASSRQLHRCPMRIPFHNTYLITTHNVFAHILTIIIGSRRVGQGFIQIRMGS
jgi:hypothetical protein